MAREICKWQMLGDREKRGFGKIRTRPTILLKRYIHGRNCGCKYIYCLSVMESLY